MDIGLVKVIGLTYNFSTLFLLGLIVYLLIKEKYVFDKFSLKKLLNQEKKVNSGVKNDSELKSSIRTRPYGLVKKLSNKGWTKEEISKKVGLPCGEIELVLKFKS